MARKLDEYKRKRDFEETPEPSGEEAVPSGDRPRFVIQHHAASTDHYDVRLEIDGVLVSWAVPKGPSTDPRERRLAVRTEDHPLDYLDFEGTIPEDEYGGGAVIVWDIGTYENDTASDDGELTPAANAVDAGHLSFTLAGHKLSGGYTLHRFRTEAGQWLLIKRSDAGADARRRPTSTSRSAASDGGDRSCTEHAKPCGSPQWDRWVTAWPHHRYFRS
jgi:DNA ligase D-like protein (predicted 3'-phosphoesterase)